MADKFPALDSIHDNLPSADGEGDADFLAREKELLGDEFKTDQDNEVLAASDDEINDFKEQYPEVGDEPEAARQQPEEEFEGFEAAQPAGFEGESKHLTEWKERRDLEIGQREEANQKKKEDIVKKAQQTIDDFYENYSNKKETHHKEVTKEEESFLEKRDGFLKRGTLWDRVNEIVDEVGEFGSDDRDKTRFKGLLKKLKGKENVAGAGGY